jgi:hypothetical protein
MRNIIILIVFVASGLRLSASEVPLVFEAAYVIDGVPGIQPSGIAVCDGKVVMVSDKHDSVIYQLNFNQDGIAKAEIWKRISDIPIPPIQNFNTWTRIKRYIGEFLGLSGGVDWEGIACNRDGDIFIASEYHLSVLKLYSDGNKEWVIDHLYQKGRQVELFQKDNAYIEGVTVVGEELILAVEREPRGLIKSKDGVLSFYIQPGPQLSIDGLPYDYTGLDSYHDKKIVLDRNHYKVCELAENNETLVCYTFGNIAKSKKWGYNTGKYGLSEGIAIDGDALWIVVDNNGDARSENLNDTRPTILKFKNPF